MTRIKLNITTEGETELKFVRNTLAIYLARFDIDTYARSVITSRGFRGGITIYERAKKDIQTWLRQNSSNEWRFTTMLDLYGLPKDFPGFQDALKKNDPYEKVKVLEEAFKKDINDYRFTPYIQLHEFEALIFADLEKLNLEFPDKKDSIQKLIDKARRKNPELIDDHPETSPSKRIIKEIKVYRKNKSTSGPNVVDIIGVPNLKNKCRHFREWVTRLEEFSKAI
ncbi:MAG TPA: DUF4276 family protein [Candidatus Deferrimicrobium sp.]|nr:DUF4276 family protein [Candidatus Kapabacteria bacterium]HLP57790.1 DUF4276 family protein [Candidatus Deferrimicrobium sp.]